MLICDVPRMVEMKKDPCVFRLERMFNTCEAGGPGGNKRKSEGQNTGRQTCVTVVPRTGRRKLQSVLVMGGMGEMGVSLNTLPG